MNDSIQKHSTVSVIISVYNTEKYLQKCVESVTSQTYQELDIILVDDGSADICAEMCDRLAETDSRIRVIHKHNGGLSSARNAGIEVASGEYIIFLDSDDWMENDTIQNAVDAAQQSESPVVIWGMSVDTVDGNETIQSINAYGFSGLCIAGEKSQIPFDTYTLNLLGYAWNKLYQRDMIIQSGARFEDNLTLIEDTIFNEQILCGCAKMMFIDYIGSHYIQRPSISLVKKYDSDLITRQMRVAYAHSHMMRHFGVDESKIQKAEDIFRIRVVKAETRQILKNNAFSETEKRDNFRRVTNDPRLKEILLSTSIHQIKDYVFVVCFKLRLFDVLKKLL